MEKLLIFLLMERTVFRSSLKKKWREISDWKGVNMTIPIKPQSHFPKTLEISFINCEISVILTWLANYFLVAGTAANQRPTFIITDTKVCGQAVTLSTQDNEKLNN